MIFYIHRVKVRAIPFSHQPATSRGNAVSVAKALLQPEKGIVFCCRRVSVCDVYASDIFQCCDQ